MNVDSEQITLDKSLVVAQDQPLSDRQLQECLSIHLAKEGVKFSKSLRGNGLWNLLITGKYIIFL